MYEKRLCASGCIITQSILTAAIAHSGLHWRMRFAQIAALEMNILQKVTTKVQVCSKNTFKELLKKPISYTLLDLPVRLDENMPATQISLYEEDRELYRIEALAIPIGFPLE